MPPITLPPGFPTVDANGIETISRFLNTPALVERALRTIVQQRFVADLILTGRVPAQGGAIMYEQNESIYADRTVLEDVMPGQEFPMSTVGTGPAAISTVKKWGIDTDVTLESVRRRRMNPVDRALLKLGNTVVKQVDTVGLAAINAQVTTTLAATAAWGNASANILLDLTTAEAMIDNLNQGYSADTLVITPLQAARLLSDKVLQAALRREDPSNPVYTGINYVGTIGGLDIFKTPNSPDTTAGWVLDRKVLGGMSDEEPFTSNSWWIQNNEKWRLRAKRVTTPWVQEPNAGIKITGI